METPSSEPLSSAEQVFLHRLHRVDEGENFRFDVTTEQLSTEAGQSLAARFPVLIVHPDAPDRRFITIPKDLCVHDYESLRAHVG